MICRQKTPLLALFVTGTISWGQALTGVIDIHVHSDPDSTARSIDAIDLAKLAKSRGMRGLVLKNHYESTAALAYIVRKEVPGIEIFGGIDLNLTVGGINPAAVERMTMMKGGWGRVVWMPTFDAENQVRDSKENRPFVPIVKNGDLLPEVKQVIGIVARHNLLLETGHSSPEEGLMLIREAKRQGMEHIVVTHATRPPVRMTVAQMQEAAKLGAFIEFVYDKQGMAENAKAIRAIGPAFCILSSDLGQPNNPLHPDGLEAFFAGLEKEGIARADVERMSRKNPATALGLP
jgi:hypothetical protein